MILLKFWKELLIGSIISILLYSGYRQVYNSGYSAAETKYTQLIEKSIQEQNTQVHLLEKSISELVINTQEYNQTLNQDMNILKGKLKNKPLVVYKDGKCTIAKEFLDSRDNAIDIANQR